MVSSDSVSVVIATLGSPSLHKTLSSLRRGTLPPSEILICIPESEVENVKSLLADDISIVVTTCRGQVAQRVEGFKRVKCNFVLQLDDDIIVSDNLIECFVNVLKNNLRSVVAPGYFDLYSGYSLYRKSNSEFLYKIYYRLLHSKNFHYEGLVTDAGLNIGVDTTISNQYIIEVDWLPGGCLMHRKENLIIKNYFPFRGKAYCEDLIHSHLLSNYEIKLLICSDAKCWTEIERTYNSLLNLIYLKFDELKKRKYFVILTGRNLTKMYIFFTINLTVTILKHFKRVLHHILFS